MGANSEDPDMPGQPGTLRPSLSRSKTRYHPITKTKSKLGGTNNQFGEFERKNFEKRGKF